MAPIAIDLGIDPELNFTATVKRGDVRSIEFTIAYQAALQGHAWTAFARFRNGLDVVELGVTATTTQVVNPSDSVHLSCAWDEAQADAWRLGTYVVDVRDEDTDHTWASGQLTIVRSASAG